MAVPDAMRRAVEVGLLSESDDPGQVAGDELFTFASERGLDSPHKNLYELATHYAAICDISVEAIRKRAGRLFKPSEADLGGNLHWQSASLLKATGTRLLRVVHVSRWTPERKMAETHSWFSLGEVCAYEMPMTLVVCVIGQNRDGRYHGAFSRAVQHPLNRMLKFRRRGGQAFTGKWTPVWREELDSPKDAWLDAMRSDGVLDEALFEIEVEVPIREVRSKVLGLARRRLEEIEQTVKTPPPCPSQCWWPQRCPYSDVCWTFAKEPSERLGYVRTQAISRAL